LKGNGTNLDALQVSTKKKRLSASSRDGREWFVKKNQQRERERRSVQ
jgi:hypothetical protein